MKNHHSTQLKFVVCLRNTGFAASLEPRKIYRVKRDAEAAGHRLIRVIDESGEDYLYPQELFAAIQLPDSVARQIRRAS